MALVEYSDIELGIGKVVLNDPDRLNAMSEEMAAEFRATVTKVAALSNKPRVLILTGAGKAFSAGGDLEMLARKQKLTGEQNRALMMEFYHSFLGLLDLEIPVIAAINGAAIGAGLCVASACDIRIAAQEAKLGFTFTRIGLHPGMGATYFLPRVVGAAVARELLLTGRVVEANEALRIGLVSKVVAAGEIQSAAISIAKEILECGPNCTRQLLQSLRTPLHSPAEALQREALCQAVNYAGAEFGEGINAIREKRKAKF